EQHARDNRDYRYVLRDTFRFEVRKGKITVVTLILDDDSDIAEDFPEDGEGQYDVRTRFRVTTHEFSEE
ncbi:MAG: hypothetical protein KC416_11285, partial [Myxococcales bacterium]|nr:hypothetical protein [Myxococcales bacterium]